MTKGPGRPRRDSYLNVEDDLPVTNELTAEAFESDTPPDIEDFLAELGITNKEYGCQVKQWPADGGGFPEFLPGNYKGSYPTIEELGKKFGPGKYQYFFKWRVPNANGVGNKATVKELTVVLSEKWRPAHEEYLFQFALQRKQRRRQMKEQAELDNILDIDERSKPKKDGIESLLDAKNQLSALGVPVGMTGQTGMELTKEGPGVFALIMQMQQKSTELLVTMMNNAQNNMMQLMTAIMSNNNGSNSYQTAFKEVTSMITGMVDIKQALNPEKQGVVDKIFNLMESVSPQVLDMLKMNAGQRRKSPVFQIAANSQELKDLKGDQQMTDALAARLDAHYGVQNTNDIMAVMGLDRSGEMKQKLRQMGYPVNPRQEETTPESPDDSVIYSQPAQQPEEQNGPAPDPGGDDIEDFE